MILSRFFDAAGILSLVGEKKEREREGGELTKERVKYDDAADAFSALSIFGTKQPMRAMRASGIYCRRRRRRRPGRLAYS